MLQVSSRPISVRDALQLTLVIPTKGAVISWLVHFFFFNVNACVKLSKIYRTFYVDKNLHKDYSGFSFFGIIASHNGCFRGSIICEGQMHAWKYGDLIL